MFHLKRAFNKSITFVMSSRSLWKNYGNEINFSAIDSKNNRNEIKKKQNNNK